LLSAEGASRQMIFATPDFGTSGGIVCFLVLIWAFVLVFALLGFAKGVKLLDGGSPRNKKFAVLLFLLSGLVPVSCCLGPSHAVRVIYGNYPIRNYPNTIRKGMTADEVVATLGTPHERHADSWYYWIDSFGISWFAVEFDQDGRVIGTHGN
jgi:SmpA / OmlA family